VVFKFFKRIALTGLFEMAKQKNKISFLRSYIKEVILSEIGGPAMASGTDPTDPRGFYSYDLPQNDIHSYWYRSPGRGQGGDGDPGRPADAEEYIGLKPKDGGGGGGAPAPEGDSGGGGDSGGANLFAPPT
jgi:hypothetical protein